MRKELAFLKKTTAAKDIKDEDVFERNGFIIARKEVLYRLRQLTIEYYIWFG
jgi:hypothetical protein